MSRIYEARLKAEHSRLIDVDPEGALKQEPYARPSEDVLVDFSKWMDEDPQLDPVIDRLMNPEETWFEQIRTLRERLRLLEKKRKIRSMGIVSTTAGEGKTTVATALSMELRCHPFFYSGQIMGRTSATTMNMITFSQIPTLV